jgi:hypothetical protein
VPRNAIPLSFGLAVALSAVGLGGAEPLVAESRGRVPVPVSPGAMRGGAITEARCPTFSWGGVAGAPGYELAVFRVSDDAVGEPELVTRVSLPADSRAWTPSVGQCLVRGERYAWSVAAQGAADGADELAWSPPFLFEVENAEGSVLEAPMGDRARLGRPIRDGGDAELLGNAASSVAGLTRGLADPSARQRLSPSQVSQGASGPAGSAAGGVSRIESAASAPSLGAASLAVSQQVHLGVASDVFKDGEVFLWDDQDGNTALGRTALSSVSGSAYNNTAVGSGALQNTTGGETYFGSYNTAIGTQALQANTTGRNNTASGAFALVANTEGYSNTATGTSALIANTTGRDNTAMGFNALASNVTGQYSVAIGARALQNNTDSLRNTAVGNRALANSISLGLYTGWRNIALGDRAGFNLTSGFSNIFIGNQGLSQDSKTIRIGYTSGSQFTGHNRVFIAGIRGVTTGGSPAISVLVDANGQLGTVSSSRDLKQDISELGPFADRMLELRPVSFRYRQHVASDPDVPLEFGLIAEEVAEVFPELVVFDEEGRPQTVRYHLLSSLLLAELQRQHRSLDEQRRQVERHEVENARLRARVAAIEEGRFRQSRRGGSRPSRGGR